jgi:DNA-binding CsgD family transcriptional regulator
MVDVVSVARLAVHGVSEELQAADGRAYAAAVTTMLEQILPGGQVQWSAVDLHSWAVAVEKRGVTDDLHTRRLRSVAEDHPMLRSYVPFELDSLRPRRISDVVDYRKFVNSRTFSELFRPIGYTHQMTILTCPPGGHIGSGWVVNRQGPDFTDRELSIATALRPALALLEDAYRDRSSVLSMPARREAPGRYALTPRELQVLGLVGEGLTAQQIAHVLRISPLTVRKHLERVYVKLDAHDRLVAVTRARAAGLIPTQTTTRLSGVRA